MNTLLNPLVHNELRSSVQVYLCAGRILLCPISVLHLSSEDANTTLQEGQISVGRGETSLSHPLSFPSAPGDPAGVETKTEKCDQFSEGLRKRVGPKPPPETDVTIESKRDPKRSTDGSVKVTGRYGRVDLPVSRGFWFEVLTLPCSFFRVFRVQILVWFVQGYYTFRIDRGRSHHHILTSEWEPAGTTDPSHRTIDSHIKGRLG